MDNNGLNPFLIALYGEPASGKTASLENIPEQDKWFYLCTEAGKEIPFRHNFKTLSVTSSNQVVTVLEKLIDTPEDSAKGLIIDSMDFLLNMYEDEYINTQESSRNGFSNWAGYSKYFRTLLQNLIVRFGRPTILIFHSETDQSTGGVRMVAKASLKGQVEAYFNTIIASKRVSIDELTPYKDKTNMLTIDEEDEITGVKYVFQLKPTMATRGEKVRSPKGLFKINSAEGINETFINNDIQLVINRLKEFYNK